MIYPEIHRGIHRHAKAYSECESLEALLTHLSLLPDVVRGEVLFDQIRRLLLVFQQVLKSNLESVNRTQ